MCKGTACVHIFVQDLFFLRALLSAHLAVAAVQLMQAKGVHALAIFAISEAEASSGDIPMVLDLINIGSTDG